MSKLRFGIAGLGCMGRSHFARLREHPQAVVTAVCDRDERRRSGDWNDALGNLEGVRTGGGTVSLQGLHAHADWGALVADPEVDVVLVALPTPLHAEVAEAALQAGKHVFCEKPMGYRVADCDRMIRAQEASGRTLMVGQCIRFWPQYEQIRTLLDAGRIGTLHHAILRRVASRPGYSAGNWLMDGGQSGGAILDLHVHDLDFAQHTFGLPAEIWARGRRDADGFVEHLVTTWSYRDGRYVLLEGGWSYTAPWPFDMGITLHGSAGTLDWQMHRGPDVLLYRGGDGPERFTVTGDALRKELDYFIDCVLAGRAVERCLPASTRTSVALAWLERRAVESGQVVHMSERLAALWGG